MTAIALQDAAGRRRSPATLPGHHVGRPPRNKGLRYPADLPSVEEIVAVMRQAGGVSLNVIQRQLGHANLGITSVEAAERVHGPLTALGSTGRPSGAAVHPSGEPRSP